MDDLISHKYVTYTCTCTSSSELLTNTGSNMLEARLCEVSQQGKGALPHLRHGILHALVEQGEQVALRYQRFNPPLQSLSQPREQVQRYDHELLIW